jgi:hypothetical protein
MCQLPNESGENGVPFLSGGEALFFLLILLAVSLCVSVLLSPASRARRRERREHETRTAEALRIRLAKKWQQAVVQGVWGTMPDGRWIACVPEHEDPSARRRRKQMLVSCNLDELNENGFAYETDTDNEWDVVDLEKGETTRGDGDTVTVSGDGDGGGL